jgi:hypothetical protein
MQSAEARMPTFRDSTLERRFDSDGFVVLPLLGTGELAQLSAARAALGVAPGDDRTGFYQDTFSDDVAHKQRVQSQLAPVLLPAVDRVLVDHRPIMFTYLVKWPGAPVLDLHFDTSLVDEAQFRSVMVWCALDDIAPGGGRLLVQPGSHRAAPSPRAHHSLQNRGRLAPGAPDGFMALSLRAGDAVVFDTALLHGSEANAAEVARVVAGVALRPAAAPLRYSIARADGSVDVFGVDDDYFSTRPFAELGRPDVAPLRRVRPHAPGFSHA